MTAAGRPSVTPQVGDTITTAEQLDALPSLTIVIDANDEVQQRHGHLTTQDGDYSAWLGVMPPTCKPSPEVALPATVLYVPGEQPGRSTDQALAEAWAEGHRTGWEHCQDGNYGNDYWDDPTPNPYAAAGRPSVTDNARAVREAAISLYRAMRRANPDAWAEVDEVEDWAYWEDIVRTAQLTSAAGRPSVTDNARAEAMRRYPSDIADRGLTYPTGAVREHSRAAFVAGAEWAAGRAETTTWNSEEPDQPTEAPTSTQWAHRNASGGASIHPTREAAEAARDEYTSRPVNPFEPPPPASLGIWRREVTPWTKDGDDQ